MNTQYYTKFSVGLIDSLLTRQQENTDYLIPLTSGRGDTASTTTINERTLVRPEKTGNDFEWMMGSQMVERPQTWKRSNLDTTVHNWLIKQEMKPVLEDIDYDYEYASPFKDGITRLLLVFKWITGIQSITKEEVRLTKQDLELIGLDKPVYHYTKLFETLFGPINSYELSKITGRYTRDLSGSLTYNKYDPDTKEWVIKVGPRDLAVANGPGSVCIKTTSYTGLLNMIIEDHDRRKKELTKEPISEFPTF